MLAMLLGAGSDTTSAMMQLFFKAMALHPEKVDLAHAGKLPVLLESAG